MPISSFEPPHLAFCFDTLINRSNFFIQKSLYEKTGNVYTAAFLNTILMTIILAANTTTYHGLI